VKHENNDVRCHTKKGKKRKNCADNEKPLPTLIEEKEPL
jgi:hypothetical protein